MNDASKLEWKWVDPFGFDKLYDRTGDLSIDSGGFLGAHGKYGGNEPSPWVCPKCGTVNGPMALTCQGCAPQVHSYSYPATTAPTAFSVDFHLP